MHDGDRYEQTKTPPSPTGGTYLFAVVLKATPDELSAFVQIENFKKELVDR